MGMVVTKEVLDKIQKDYKTQNRLNSPKRREVKTNITQNVINPENLGCIYHEFYSTFPYFENRKVNLLDIKDKKSENIIELKTPTPDIEEEISKKEIIEKIENKKNEEKQLENRINHNSFDFSCYNIKNIKSLLINNGEEDNIKVNKENCSEIDNLSNNSDYIDIGNMSYFKKVTNAQNVRVKYYNKILTKNVYNPLKKENPVNNIFIFDWDDTLLCTSYLQPAGLLNNTEINPKDREIFDNLDENVEKLLNKAISKGMPYIITNAAPGWIEYSSRKFYPKTAKILKNVRILSARGLFSKKLPGDNRQWKTNAFIKAFNKQHIRKTIPTNIVAFGDSILEIEATHKIREIFANAYIKTIKFKENPSPSELEKQIKLITGQFETILSNVKNLSIRVSKKKSE